MMMIRITLFFLLLTPFFKTENAEAKMFVRKEYTIDTERTFRYNDRWAYIAKSESESLKELIKVLATSKTGKKVLALAAKKAKSYGLELEDVIHPGSGSLTDTTLIRRFSPGNAHEIVYESRSKVYINRGLSVKNAILDMAHELVHFSLREPFNPYKNDFGLKDFVVSTVEGKGGEVEAYLVECQVNLELFPHNDSNCSQVVSEATGEVSKKLGIEKFYQMGRYYSIFLNSLKKHNLSGQDFSYMGREKADFISSAYGLPYPLAAVHEYESIMQRVCLNDEKRLAIIKDNLTRSPAQVAKEQYQSLIHGHEQKCGAFLAQNQF
tara:strand:+ start:30505 stop:31473 length:969 start_codon:yes stop_codon:yes gene_type:complete